MVQLTCRCYNVRIHAKDTVIQPTPVETLNLTNEELSHKFFQHDVATVMLDLGGITKAQSILITNCQVGDWVIQSCAGCGMDTHAKRVEQGKQHTLINFDLINETKLNIKLTETENYSPVFKIIVPEINDNCFDLRAGGLEFQMKSKKLDSSFTSVDKQVATYLQQEQKAMEERIRIFTQQQKSNFVILQKKVRRDKQAMLSLLLRLQEKELKESLGDAISENSSFTQTILPFSMNSVDNSSHDEQLNSINLPQTQIEVKEKTTAYKRSMSTDYVPKKINPVKSQILSRRKIKSVDVDSGGIFDMEGVDHKEDSNPFYNSDYEGDTDDSSATEDSARQAYRSSIAKQCAQSLPISIPAWSPLNHSSGSEEEEKITITGDPEQIAASIQALTVKDGTEMFGDLPRRRLNTLDLVKSRPL